MATWRKRRSLRILHVDIENMPLSYGGGDWTFDQVTAIAWRFTDERPYYVLCLGEVPYLTMIVGFCAAYIQADIVSGHNVKEHDLKKINGALLEEGLSPLPARLVSDTYTDLKRRSGVSASQESLAAMLKVKAPKIGMSQKDWREANRLTPAGIAKTKRRVVGDVKQHVQLRAELLKRGWLRAPRMWRP